MAFQRQLEGRVWYYGVGGGVCLFVVRCNLDEKRMEWSDLSGKNECSVGDELVLLPHRLLSLGENKVAVISENSSGWCVASTEDYLYVRDLFSNKLVFSDVLSEQAVKLVKLLWDADLAKKNGSCLSELIPSSNIVLLVLKMTSRCNFSCLYCYDYQEDKIGKVIPMAKVKETIAFVLSRNRILNVVFHGGEPLLCFPFIKELVEFTVKESGETKNVSFSIQTNGALFNKEIISFLDKHDFSIGLSLDGMTEQANTLRATKIGYSCLEVFNRNIKNYREVLTRRSGVISTLSQVNLEETPDFVLWLQHLGIGSIRLGPLMSSGRGVDMTEYLISPRDVVGLMDVLVKMVRNQEINRIAVGNIIKIAESLIVGTNHLCYLTPCGAGKNFLVIDADGSYRACDCIYHDYFVLDGKNMDCLLMKRPKILDRVEYMKHHTCGDCAIFGLCGGGCVSEAVASHGTDRSLPERDCNEKKFLYKTFLKEFAYDKQQPLFAYYRNLMNAQRSTA